MPVIEEKLACLAREANDAHAQTQRHYKRGAEHAVAAGKALVKAKRAVPHGQWGPWLARNFEGSERIAQVYMRMARHRFALDDETRNAVADFSLREAVKAIAETRTLHVTTYVEEPEPITIRIDASEPEPALPSPSVAHHAGHAAPAWGGACHPSSSLGAEASRAASISCDGSTAAHVEALLACMRSTRPAEFSRAVADDAICEAADLEELASWLADAAGEISRLGAPPRLGA